jgi:hypothetical protein
MATLFANQMATMVATLTQKMDDTIAAITAKADEQLGAVTAQLDDLNARVGSAEEVAKAAKEAVSGTVVLGSESGDDPATAPVAKQEVVQGSFGGREIDTAFLVRKKNNGRNR